ncbi:unnamed protein product [Bursaphelenchus xylophilus]|uniref:(pine wood nematode) hypothetical protein n=1 Tax=Bursaphelenchus xylophilus TaxID=6326 RepID=A0A1I7SF40_BURXY|nr:unnamed protein product [Bursaphelenchus xylophilus]CAG9078860.1 unnamed protein product [Bursaphelenchus xylophilus]
MARYLIMLAMMIRTLEFGLVEACTSTTVTHLPPTPPTPMGCITCPTEGLEFLFVRTHTVTDNADGCNQLTLYCSTPQRTISFNNGAIETGQQGQITLQCGEGGWVFDGQVISEMTCTG